MIQGGVPNATAGSSSSTLQIPPDLIPAGAVTISVAFFAMFAVIIIGWPIARAIGRRMDRKGVEAPNTKEMSARMERIEQAVDSIAIEVERISEGQRFTNKLMSEGRGAGEQALIANEAKRG
jgi:Na+/glutamate symporter